MKKDLTKWHSRFAWLPTIIDGTELWFTFYERKLHITGKMSFVPDYFIYRLKGDK